MISSIRTTRWEATGAVSHRIASSRASFTVWAEKPRYPTGTCLLFTKGMDIRAVADRLTDVAISLG